MTSGKYHIHVVSVCEAIQSFVYSSSAHKTRQYEPFLPLFDMINLNRILCAVVVCALFYIVCVLVVTWKNAYFSIIFILLLLN